MAAPRITAFGLDILPDRPLALLPEGAAAPTGRSLELVVAGAPAWSEGARLISDERAPDGEVVFQIEQAAAGYRISGPRYGDAVLAADGRSVAGAAGSGGERDWERLLIAQVLPFAAVLQGLEVLHASAVEIDGRAIALLGRSGAGKTSVAVAMLRLGASFLADDVLAVECRGDRLLCHPGSPVAAIDRAEAAALRRDGRLNGADLLAEDEREEIVRVAPGSVAPLKALFVLDRRPDGPARPRFEPVTSPSTMLSSTFNLLVTEPTRLESLLEVCATAAAGRVERAVAGPEVDSSALAAAIAARIEEAG